MIYFNIISFTVTVAAFIVYRNYRKSYVRELWPEKKRAGLQYGLPIRIYDTYKRVSAYLFKDRRDTVPVKAQLEKLMPLCSVHEAEEKLYSGIIGIFLWAWLLVHILAVVFVLLAKTPVPFENGNLFRPKAGELPYTAQLEMENDVIGKSEVDVTVSPKLYTEAEREEAFKRAEDYIISEALGGNKDWKKVQGSLNFVKNVPDTGISVEWSVGNYELIDDSGNIIKKDISEQGEDTFVTAKLIYEDISRIIEIPVKVFPKALTEQQRLLNDIRNSLSEADSKYRDEDWMTLPNSLDGHSLVWSVPKKDTAAAVTLLGSILACMCAICKISELKTKVKARDKQLVLDYPDFVYKLILLNGAGMSLKLSVETMLGDAKSAGRDGRYVWQEVQAVLRAMAQGVSEVQAYELFGQRCAQLPYLKLSSLMVQSLKKGVGGIGRMMSDAADEAVMMKREAAVKAGEEVGTKLLMPMGLLLVVVLIILVVPAFMTMNI